MKVFLCLEIGYFHPAWYFQLKNKRAISFVQDLEEGGNWTDRQIRIWLHEAAGPIVWSAQKTALKLENQKRSEQAGQILAVLRDFIWVGLLWRTLAFAKEAESWQLEETGGFVGQNSQHSQSSRRKGSWQIVRRVYNGSRSLWNWTEKTVGVRPDAAELLLRRLHKNTCQETT